VFDFLAITIDYTEKGKVKLYMKEYIDKILSEFPYMEEVKQLKPVSTPAAEHLFVTSTKAEKLDRKKKEAFHTTVAQTLFLTKRPRPDLQPTVPFLCTRVKDPDIHDWKKLLRLLKYLQRTRNKELVLEATPGDKIIISVYPDSAFAVHQDMKSHTGVSYALGKGSVNTISAKQKLNTKSSTEAELVGADDAVTPALWMKLFLEAQGYEVEVIVYQDNTSTIQLENNGKESSGKRTRHLNIRYFFITDCIKKKLLRVEYCPTDDMIGDFPSKPLQGRKFKKHCRLIMNSTE